MTAEKAPRPEPNDERAEKFVAESQQEYAELVTQARDSADMTRTPAWQTTYANNVRAHRDALVREAKRIIAACEAIKATGSTEDIEKDIGDGRKAIIEERERFESWKSLSVLDMARLVERARAVKDGAVTRAKFEEQERGLMCAGLTEEVRKIVSKWPVPVFNHETGVMTVQ